MNPWLAEADGRYEVRSISGSCMRCFVLLRGLGRGERGLGCVEKVGKGRDGP